MMISEIAVRGLAFALLAAAGTARADVIGGADIVPTTTITSYTTLYPIEAIADGITSDASPYNGFAATPGEVGTIHLDLVGEFDLDAFRLWNDINVYLEGIKDFRLDFFDAGDVLIESSPPFVGPVGAVDPVDYSFPTVFSVSRVDLVVLSLHAFQPNGPRLEIREVAFEGSIVTAVRETPNHAALKLEAAYPNPFNPSTSLPYSLDDADFVRLSIYDANGRFVADIVRAERSAGEHVAAWDGRGASGAVVSSGIYFARIESRGQVRTRKIVLLK